MCVVGITLAFNLRQIKALLLVRIYLRQIKALLLVIKLSSRLGKVNNHEQSMELLRSK